MTAIIIPRRHYTQPQGRVEVDPSFESAYAWLPQYGGKRTTGVVTPFGTAQKCGMATGGTAEESASYIEAVGGKAYFGKRPQWCVIAGKFQSLSAPVRAFGCGQAMTLSTAAQLQILSTGAIEFATNSGNWKAYSVAATHRADGTFCVGYSIDESGLLTVVLNGRMLGSQAGWTSLPTPSVDPAFGMIYASASNQLMYGSGSEIGFAAFGNGVDVARKARALTENPWQLFRADPIRIYSLPTGAISINSITASNIAQTGARITLGLTR